MGIGGEPLSRGDEEYIERIAAEHEKVLFRWCMCSRARASPHYAISAPSEMYEEYAVYCNVHRCMALSAGTIEGKN